MNFHAKPFGVILDATSVSVVSEASELEP